MGTEGIRTDRLSMLLEQFDKSERLAQVVREQLGRVDV